MSPAIEGLERLPENLFREPLDALYAEHVRLGAVCTYLTALESDDEALDRKVLDDALHYLVHDLPLHIQDEEVDLFPLLLERIHHADSATGMVKQFQSEHRQQIELVEEILVSARDAAKHASFLRSAFVFGEMQLRHMQWENSVLLPLARRRLSEADLQLLGQHMAARRGIPYPD